MSDIYTSGNWKVNDGSDEQFVEAWTQFVGWASTLPSSGTFKLLRDLREPGRYISIGEWETITDAEEWKTMPEFRERLARVLQHVTEFHSSNFDEIVTVAAGETAAGAVA